MASTLNRTGESRPNVTRGHGTGSLGPSDTSDTGSDVVGGPGMGDLEPLDLDRGTTSDPDRRGSTAGPDIGDADLDSDTDASGTGENIGAGRDPMHLNQDRAPDRVDDYPDLDDDVLAKQEREEEPDPTGRAGMDEAAAQDAASASKQANPAAPSPPQP